MKWCQRCLLPDTRPNLVIEDDGICNACHAFETRNTIDWEGRQQAFRDVVEHARKQASGYDCLIPVSGGKDSTWQVVKCLEYGLRPLAVTWCTPARTEIGRKNLENLVSLGVDHIDYRINPETEARFMLKAFRRYGSTAIPMHLALFNIPLNIAVKFNIPLIVWGENSAFEYGSADEAHTGFRLDNDWLRTYGVTHGTTAEDWIDDELSRRDLVAYKGPTPGEVEAQGIRAVFLGYYFAWDPVQSFEVARQHGFESASDARTGFYNFADIDDDFISIHHWMKWYKFGFTRMFDNLSLEIRFGRISRTDAIKKLLAQGEGRPVEDINSFCAFAGISSDEFYEIAEQYRNTSIWKQQPDGTWYIPEFMINDWSWT